MKLNQIIQSLTARKEAAWNELQAASAASLNQYEWQAINTEWRTINGILNDLIMVQLDQHTRFTFKDFEEDFTGLMYTLLENAQINMDNSKYPFVYSQYHDGYVDAINSAIRHFQNCNEIYKLGGDDK